MTKTNVAIYTTEKTSMSKLKSFRKPGYTPIAYGNFGNIWFVVGETSRSAPTKPSSHE